MCCDWEISVARLVAWLDFHMLQYLLNGKNFYKLNFK